MIRKFNFFLVTVVVFMSGLLTHSNLANAIATPQSMQIKKIVKLGQASWYSEKSPGVRPRTASNEVFDDSELTCAMWGVPFHQMVKVTNLDNGKSVIVRVNDRGPHTRYYQRGRIIDLTQKAFSQLSNLKHGIIRVQIEFL